MLSVAFHLYTVKNELFAEDGPLDFEGEGGAGGHAGKVGMAVDVDAAGGEFEVRDWVAGIRFSRSHGRAGDFPGTASAESGGSLLDDCDDRAAVGHDVLAGGGGDGKMHGLHLLRCCIPVALPGGLFMAAAI